MMDADFMPNKSGTFFTFAKKEDTEREELAVREARDVLVKILERLDERIAHYKSIDSIDDAILADPTLFSHTVAANKLTAANLLQEREVIQALIDS